MPNLYTKSSVRLVNLPKFLISTRDSGYKDTCRAIAELVDNSIEADASGLIIRIQKVSAATQSREEALRVAVIDDGVGMSIDTLRLSLQFGGSGRFNSRQGMGRFGMGLPNASISQARKITVYSWTSSQGQILTAQLDVDRLLDSHSETEGVSIGKVETLPSWVGAEQSLSGTVVTWENCDRLDYQRISSLENRLVHFLGRSYRHYLKNGLNIKVNDKKVSLVDPLFLEGGEANQVMGTLISRNNLEVYANPFRVTSDVGTVQVCFSLLPVERYASLPSKAKRDLGITNAPIFSICRKNREIDTTWFLKSVRKKENYDDWWRCEINFSPELDEAFGVSHTKQGIRPTTMILEALAPYIDSTARELLIRVKRAHKIQVTHSLHQNEKSTGINRMAQTSFTRDNSQIHPPDFDSMNLNKVKLSYLIDKGWPGNYTLGTSWIRGEVAKIDLSKNFEFLGGEVSLNATDSDRVKTMYLVFILAWLITEENVLVEQEKRIVAQFRSNWSKMVSKLSKNIKNDFLGKTQ